MTEPTLTCPTCRTQIKLTESLAAPLIEVTRKRFEAQLARKEAEVAGREAAIRDQQAQIAAARNSIDAQVAAKIDEEAAASRRPRPSTCRRLHSRTRFHHHGKTPGSILIAAGPRIAFARTKRVAHQFRMAVAQSDADGSCGCEARTMRLTVTSIAWCSCARDRSHRW
jgi:multidrug resistance efflux pump